MANRIRSRSPQFVRGKRRETRWLDAIPTEALLSGASTPAILLTLTAAELALRPFTIIRTRGHWTAQTDQFVASEDYQVALGLAVVSDQAVAIGVTAVPTPYTDMESDLWFVYEQLYGRQVFGTGVGFDASAGVHAGFDSKAMRKVEDGQDVIVVVESSSVSSGMNVAVGFRMLVKLH